MERFHCRREDCEFRHCRVCGRHRYPDDESCGTCTMRSAAEPRRQAREDGDEETYRAALALWGG